MNGTLKYLKLLFIVSIFASCTGNQSIRSENKTSIVRKEVVVNKPENKQVKKGDMRELYKIYSSYMRVYGDTFILIDTNRQNMIYMKKGVVLANTKVVTGRRTTKKETPRGSFRVYFKQRNRVLIGDDYETPVSYWVAFNDKIGIHDSNWRRNYGGQIYVRNGSRGCINVPPRVMAEIYHKIDRGTRVHVI